ncbi:histidine-rich glycoprotein [Manduca sexta]|uniref:Uncharacterized protein n=1 Tax=Manduca sexta TaxID=7130 RepID=A0A921ZWM9_MANSE|nr:histidine-rich glycoprotein [Manduca sexta]KAG6465451.1 hypothetical protein O3G_MSEX015157 [Manduca sexta]
MSLKVVFLLAILAVVAADHGFSSQYIHKHDGHHEVVSHGHDHHHHDYYTVPKYEFEYKVDDHHTGDHKVQHEKRDHDVTDSDYKTKIEHIVPHHHH